MASLLFTSPDATHVSIPSLSRLAATVQRRGSVSESGARGGGGGGAAGNNEYEEFQSIEKRKTERRKSLDLGIREGRTEAKDIRRNLSRDLPLSSTHLVFHYLLDAIIQLISRQCSTVHTLCFIRDSSKETAHPGYVPGAGL